MDNITVYVHDRASKRTHYGDSPGDQLRKAKASQALLLERNSARARPISFVDIPNLGDEAAAYLLHIVTHYDELPEVLFFIHGHRCAKHATPDMVRLLEDRLRCFRPGNGYETLNDPWQQHVCPARGSSSWEKDYRVGRVQKAWPELFAEEFGAFPEKFCFDSYGQFVVSRERVLSHPRAFYQRLLEGANAGKTTMEWSWRTLFVPGFL